MAIPVSIMQSTLMHLSQDVENWFADCLEKLPGSAWLHVFAAQYAHIYRANKHIESLHLTAAEGKHGKFDVIQLVQQRRAQIRRAEEASGAGAMSVVSRIKFEKHRGLVDEHTLRARQDQMRFIEELTAPHPAPHKLDAIAKSFQKSLHLAEESFAFLLKLNPDSSSVLRKYAVFLDEVCNDNLKATKIANQADDIDAATEKEQAEIGAAMVMFSKVLLGAC
jgi:acyl-CoA-binding protein